MTKKQEKKYIRPDRNYPWRASKRCPVCEKEFLPYTKNSKFCSAKCHNRKYSIFLKNDPIKYRAHTMAGKIKGFTRAMAEKMLENTLNRPCKYCGELITIKNASLDHKEPLLRHLKRSPKIIERLNKKDNLQIICKRCNFFKLSLNDEEYKKLSDFLRKEPAIEKKLMARIWIKPFGRRI